MEKIVYRKTREENLENVKDILGYFENDQIYWLTELLTDIFSEYTGYLGLSGIRLYSKFGIRDMVESTRTDIRQI